MILWRFATVCDCKQQSSEIFKHNKFIKTPTYLTPFPGKSFFNVIEQRREFSSPGRPDLRHRLLSSHASLCPGILRREEGLRGNKRSPLEASLLRLRTWRVAVPDHRVVRAHSQRPSGQVQVRAVAGVLRRHPPESNQPVPVQGAIHGRVARL